MPYEGRGSFTPEYGRGIHSPACSLWAISGLARCDVIDQMQAERPPRGGPSISFDVSFVQAASTCAFRFLRQPSSPITPRPEVKSGRAAGSGVAE
jgi:hypothetical protein